MRNDPVGIKCLKNPTNDLRPQPGRTTTYEQDFEVCILFLFY